MQRFFAKKNGCLVLVSNAMFLYVFDNRHVWSSYESSRSGSKDSSPASLQQEQITQLKGFVSEVCVPNAEK